MVVLLDGWPDALLDGWMVEGSSWTPGWM